VAQSETELQRLERTITGATGEIDVCRRNAMFGRRTRFGLEPPEEDRKLAQAGPGTGSQGRELRRRRGSPGASEKEGRGPDQRSALSFTLRGALRRLILSMHRGRERVTPSAQCAWSTPSMGADNSRKTHGSLTRHCVEHLTRIRAALHEATWNTLRECVEHQRELAELSQNGSLIWS